MKRLLIFSTVFFLIQPFLIAQRYEDSIDEKEVSSVLNFLASDDLKGRGNYTPELITAANFIAGKYKEYGLQPFPGDFSFHQPFNGRTSRDIYRDEVEWNGRELGQAEFIYLSPEIAPEAKTLSDFTLIELTGAFSDSIFFAHWTDTTNTLIFWKADPQKRQKIPFDEFKHPGFPPSANILFVIEDELPRTVSVSTAKNYLKNVLFNVVGVLPGRSRKNEVVIFSAHYDHIGSAKGKGDKIFNGANDDASGVTAVLMLAKYFSLLGDNERTIFFCAFAGEELGLYGSSYLSELLHPEKITAVINIEMIGKTNVTGRNAFYITGASYSNLEKIFKSNLSNEKITIKPEPGRDLFERSDNYSFAKKGVPAHTVMCSDDYDPCYHKPCDEVKKIDMENMTRIIRAIAKASESIISGKDTPSRINVDDIK
jgi:hypothetical protein